MDCKTRLRCSLVLCSIAALFNFAVAHACPVDSKGCDRPRPDTAHIFFYLTGAGRNDADARQALAGAAADLKKSLADSNNITLTVDFSGVAGARQAPSQAASQAVTRIQYGAVQYKFPDGGGIEVEHLNGLTQVMDAVVAAGAQPLAPLGYGASRLGTVGAEDPFGFKKHGGSLDGGSQNYVLFTVSQLEPFLGNAIKNGLERISAAADMFGKLIDDKAQGLDNLAISHGVLLRPWRGLSFGPISLTFDDVNINVNLTADVHFSHADLRGGHGGHDHGQYNGQSAKRTLSATGHGIVEIPAEKAIIFHREEAGAEKPSECVNALQTKVYELKAIPDLNKASGAEVVAGGIGFTVDETYSYSHEFSIGALIGGETSGEPAVKKRTGCYRNLTVTVSRMSTELLESFSGRVAHISDKLSSDKSESPAFYSHLGGANETRVYYLAKDLSPFVSQVLQRAFSDAQAKAGRLAEIRGEKIGAIMSLHPEGNISLEELLDGITLGESYYSGQGLTLLAGAVDQSLSADLTVNFAAAATPSKI